MALPTTNISTVMVREALQISENGIWALCNDATLNKWNKYKPVVGNWPQVDGSYGLKRSDWSYYTRTPAKLSHFAGYEADSTLVFPPIHSIGAYNTIETLYPSGSTVDNKWFVYCYKTNSDVRLTPADLGLNSYYYGFKVTVDGTTWYKTKGLISGFTAGQDSSTEIWMTATLQNPLTTPSFYDLPYGVGTYTWTLILCATAASAWTTSAPDDVIEFMYDTLGEKTYSKTGTFTVANWYYVQNNNLVEWNAAGNGEQSVNIYTNKYPWGLSGVPAWITANVYFNGNYISNPNLYETDSSLRLTCAENTGVARSANILIGSGEGAIIVSVSQAAPVVAPTFVWNVIESTPITSISNETHGMSAGSTDFNLSFNHDHTGGDAYIFYSISDASGTMASGTGNPNGILLHVGAVATKSGTLNWAVKNNTTVTIQISIEDV